MVEIGRFTPVSKEQNYIPGQFFLHAQKGYRGVIVCPCTLNLNDSGGETGAFDSEVRALFRSIGSASAPETCLPVRMHQLRQRPTAAGCGCVCC